MTPPSVFGWTADKGGLARIRIRLPLEELAKHGWETELDTVMMRRHGEMDTIVGCRVANPDPSKLWTHACGMLGGPFMVFETDDDNFNISRWNAPQVYTFWHRPDIQAQYLSNLRIAHRIVTSTDYLADRLYDQTGHPDIMVAHSAVPEWMRQLPRYGIEKDQDAPLVVGWAGGSSHAGDWDYAKQGISRALRKKPEVKLRFVGQDYRRVTNVPDGQMEHIPWFESVDDYWEHGLNFDIGLAPLRPEGFNKGKSEIRPLELGARGIPVIAQDYGPYSDFVEHDFTGLLVKTPKQWTEAIIYLIENPDVRARFGLNAWAKAKGHTIEAIWSQYAEAYTA